MCFLTSLRLTTRRLSVRRGEKNGRERQTALASPFVWRKMAKVFWLVNLHESKTCSPSMSLSFGGDVIKHIHFNLMVCGLLNSSFTVNVIIAEAGKKSPSMAEAGASAQTLMNSRVLLCASKYNGGHCRSSKRAPRGLSPLFHVAFFLSFSHFLSHTNTCPFPLNYCNP